MQLAASRTIDHLAVQSSPSSQSARHRTTQECLWVADRRDTCWIQEELKERQLQPLLKFNEEEEEGGGKEEKRIGGGQKEAEEQKNDDDEGSLISHGTSSKIQEDRGSLVQSQQHHAALEPSESTDALLALVASLKACTRQRDLHAGSRIHDDIVCKGLLQNNVFLGSALVNMYAKCGALAKAQDVFDDISSRDVVLWNALMAGYAQQGDAEKVQACFERMQCEGLSPDAVTVLSVLKACAISGTIDKGKELHARISTVGIFKEDEIVGTALVDMYAKCGLLEKARKVFDSIPVRNVVSWNALISGYVQHGHAEDALICFEHMRVEGISPTIVTFLSILKACGSAGAGYMGQEIHSRIIREGLLDDDTMIGTALIDMYAKCGLLVKAQEVFDKLLAWDVVAWNALIAGYAQQEHSEKALNCFEQMKSGGFFPDDTTLSSSLKACASMRLADEGQEIHMELVKNGLWEESFVVGNALVDMYAKCGMLEDARKVFDNRSVRNVVTWNTLITGYVQEGHSEQALTLYRQMQVEGPSPDSVTFIGVLKGCGSLGAVYMGQHVHAEIVEVESLETDLIVGTALVDMYASCGMPAEAQKVFDDLQTENVVSWNALLEGYSQNGMDEHVFDSYNKMIGGSAVPDVATCGIILNACSHIGLFDESLMYLETMCIINGLTLTSEQFCCLVDLFSRAGCLDEAVILIKEMPFSPNLAVWHTLLSACGKCGNITIGRLAFEYAEKLDEAGSAAYVCMSQI